MKKGVSGQWAEVRAILSFENIYFSIVGKFLVFDFRKVVVDIIVYTVT